MSCEDNKLAEAPVKVTAPPKRHRNGNLDTKAFNNPHRYEDHAERMERKRAQQLARKPNPKHRPRSVLRAIFSRGPYGFPHR